VQKAGPFYACQPRCFFPHRAAGGDATGPRPGRGNYLLQVALEIDAGAEQHPGHLRCFSQFLAGGQPLPLVRFGAGVQWELDLEHIHTRNGRQLSSCLDHCGTALLRGKPGTLRTGRVGQGFQEQGHVRNGTGISRLAYQGLDFGRRGGMGMIVNQKFHTAGPQL